MFLFMKDISKKIKKNNNKDNDKLKDKLKESFIIDKNKNKKNNRKKKNKKNNKNKKENNFVFLKDYIRPIVIQIILIIVLLNIFLFFLLKPTYITGQFFLNKDNNYSFVPDINQCDLTIYHKFYDYEIGDTIYAYTPKNGVAWNYNNKKVFNCHNIKGKIVNKTDYYLIIDFGLNKEIPKELFIKQKFKTNNKISVPIKRFLGKYMIFLKLK